MPDGNGGLSQTFVIGLDDARWDDFDLLGLGSPTVRVYRPTRKGIRRWGRIDLRQYQRAATLGLHRVDLNCKTTRGAAMRAFPYGTPLPRPWKADR